MVLMEIKNGVAFGTTSTRQPNSLISMLEGNLQLLEAIGRLIVPEPKNQHDWVLHGFVAGRQVDNFCRTSGTCSDPTTLLLAPVSSRQDLLCKSLDGLSDWQDIRLH